MEDSLLVLVNALVAMSILALVALGFWVILSVMGFFNFAQGEFLMLGAYGAVIAQAWHVDPWLGVLFGGLLMGVLGWILEKTLVRHVVLRPVDALLMTWGLSLVLKQAARLVFGPKPRMVPSPISENIVLSGIEFPAYRLVLIAASLVLVLGTLAMLRYTRFGLETRAAFQDDEMARANGVHAPRMWTGTFVFACFLSGVAGALIAPLSSVNPEMGMQYLIKGILAVIMGGPASVTGVLGGAAVIGGSESTLSSVTSSVLSQAAVFALAIVVIRLRPSGLFVRKEVAALYAPRAMN